MKLQLHSDEHTSDNLYEIMKLGKMWDKTQRESLFTMIKNQKGVQAEKC